MYSLLNKFRPRDNTLPARTGQLWNEKEETDLLTYVRQGMTLEEIAKIHQRTERAIKLKIIDKAIIMLSNNVPLEEVLTLCGNKITKEEIDEHIKNKEEKKNKKMQNPDNLAEICTQLKRIADALEKINNK